MNLHDDDWIGETNHMIFLLKTGFQPQKTQKTQNFQSHFQNTEKSGLLKILRLNMHIEFLSMLIFSFPGRRHAFD